MFWYNLFKCYVSFVKKNLYVIINSQTVQKKNTTKNYDNAQNKMLGIVDRTYVYFILNKYIFIILFEWVYSL